jgi:shikimate kinase
MLHLEFIGTNGAGKSTLYRQCNDYLAARLGYKPGPDKLWLDLINDQALQPARIRDSRTFQLLRALDPGHRLLRKLPTPSAANFGLLARAALRMSDLLQRTIQLSAAGAMGGDVPVAYAHWDMQYFLTLLAYYQMRVESTEQKFLLLDEGFVSALTEHVVKGDSVDEPMFSALLESNFPIRVLIHVRADVETCLRRLDSRTVPAPLAHLSPPALRASLEQRADDIVRICERMRKAGTRVVEVHNQTTPEASFETIKPYLDAILP